MLTTYQRETKLFEFSRYTNGFQWFSLTLFTYVYKQSYHLSRRRAIPENTGPSSRTFKPVIRCSQWEKWYLVEHIAIGS